MCLLLSILRELLFRDDLRIPSEPKVWYDQNVNVMKFYNAKYCSTSRYKKNLKIKHIKDVKNIFCIITMTKSF